MNLKKILHLISHPSSLITSLCSRGYMKWLPDSVYLRCAYKSTLKKPLNLKNVRTFNEKLQWLKLYDRKPLYTQMVDKYEAKRYVSQKIGEEYIIPTLGVWEKFEDIDFDNLPNEFVLKCTHDSGGLAICKNKATFDFDRAKKKIQRSLGRNYYWSGREWPYKDVKPRIIAEQYMEDHVAASGLTDYKFYCFNGDPKFLYISKGLEDHSTARISFVTLDWQFAPYQRSDYLPYEELPQKPVCFDEMIEIAKKLSSGIPFLRVDLYEINSKIYFSELTFFPTSGTMPFKNPDHDLELGNMLILPDKK